MIELLFAVLFWLAIFWAACGVLLIATFLWFLLFDGPPARRPSGRRAPPRPIQRFAYDPEDPLERALLLPDAPNPRRHA